MSEFITGDNLYVMTVSKPKVGFVLTKPLVYKSDRLGTDVNVPSGFFTDFASIPPIVRGFIPVNAKHRKAAVVHDFLIEAKSWAWLEQSTKDAVLLEAMEVCGTRLTRRRAMYRGVRMFQAPKTVITKTLRRWGWMKPRVYTA